MVRFRSRRKGRFWRNSLMRKEISMKSKMSISTVISRLRFKRQIRRQSIRRLSGSRRMRIWRPRPKRKEDSLRTWEKKRCLSLRANGTPRPRSTNSFSLITKRQSVIEFIVFYFKLFLKGIFITLFIIWGFRVKRRRTIGGP